MSSLALTLTQTLTPKTLCLQTGLFPGRSLVDLYQTNRVSSLYHGNLTLLLAEQLCYL